LLPYFSHFFSERVCALGNLTRHVAEVVFSGSKTAKMKYQHMHIAQSRQYRTSLFLSTDLRRTSLVFLVFFSFRPIMSRVGSLFDDWDQVSVVLDKIKKSKSKDSAKKPKESASDKKRKREDSSAPSTPSAKTIAAATNGVAPPVTPSSTIHTTDKMDTGNGKAKEDDEESSTEVKEPASKRKKEKETIVPSTPAVDKKAPKKDDVC
jgi:hypothetical protein